MREPPTETIRSTGWNVSSQVPDSQGYPDPPARGPGGGPGQPGRSESSARPAEADGPPAGAPSGAGRTPPARPPAPAGPPRPRPPRTGLSGVPGRAPGP